MGTKINPGNFDCYAAAAPDEPLFVLLGRDPLAPTLVRLWALLRSQEGESDEAKVQEALTAAEDMQRWIIQNRPGKCKKLTNAAACAITRLYLGATCGMAKHLEGYSGTCDCADCNEAKRILLVRNP